MAHIVIMEKMETSMVYWGYLGIMEKWKLTRLCKSIVPSPT